MKLYRITIDILLDDDVNPREVEDMIDWYSRNNNATLLEVDTEELDYNE